MAEALLRVVLVNIFWHSDTKLYEENKKHYENQAVLFSNDEKEPLMMKLTTIVRPVRKSTFISDYFSVPVTP